MKVPYFVNTKLLGYSEIVDFYTMTLKYLLTIFVCSLVSLFISAQNPERCGTDALHELNMQDPEFAAEHQAKLDRMRVYRDTQDRLDGRMPICANPILIPVAVHFQGTTIPQACAIDMAVSQIDALNADFAATNFDIDNWNVDVSPLFPGINNAESCIQFCLATLNHPTGFGLVDGNYAVTLNQTTGDSDAAWTGYMNFFVRDLGGGVLGYSPLGGNGNGDGIACDIGTFGLVNCGGNTINPPYNLGRTMTHEVGHYLLLEHPWGGGGCASTDDVADTPVTDNPTFGCPNATFVNCTNNVLWPTYMEYCDDLCLFMFTAGQVDRMEDYVNTSLQNLIDNSVTKCSETACQGFDGNVVEVDETCDGNDGSLTLNTVEGNPPFEYSITNGVIFQTGNVFGNLSAGTYDVVITDAAGCEYMETVSLQREEAQLSLVQTQAAFCGASDGLLEVTTSSGPNFEFNFNGGPYQPSGLFANVPSGNHLIEAQNPAGCTGAIFVNVDDENDLGIEIEEVKAVNCFLFDNGKFSFSLNGGEEPFFFELDDSGELTDVPVFEMLSPGDHIVEIEDGRGCKATIPFTIFRNANSLDEDCPCVVYMPNAFTPDGDDVNERFVPQTACPLQEFFLQIYDRFGTIVFETDDINVTWGADGGNAYYVADGVYHYTLKYAWGEDSDSSISRRETGSITVIR
ncbi:MAG: hypothetical protein HKN45_02340 [Flavobacteriales bacterium]|nr:hypothetical protein [Flavobacteriales bacterium]